jgi:hypothetical protein
MSCQTTIQAFMPILISIVSEAFLARVRTLSRALFEEFQGLVKNDLHMMPRLIRISCPAGESIKQINIGAKPVVRLIRHNTESAVVKVVPRKTVRGLPSQ